jgi:hypothetical protein
MIGLCSRVAAGFFVAALATPIYGQSNVFGRWQVRYTQVYAENFEGPNLAPGLNLEAGTSIVSLRMDDRGRIVTHLFLLPLESNTPYIVELQYRVLNRGSNTDLLYLDLSPGNSDQQSLRIYPPSLYRNVETSGTFSSGAQTNLSGPYVLGVNAGIGVSILIDNIVIYRQDAVAGAAAPPGWSKLGNLAFPRLGAWYQENPDYTALGGKNGVPPYSFTVDQVEKRLAIADVIAGLEAQGIGNDSLRRLRTLNPDGVILTFLPVEDTTFIPPQGSGVVSLISLFQQGIADPWYVKDSRGGYLESADGLALRKLNVTPQSPVVNGKRFSDYLVDWMSRVVFPSGMWDGFFSDDLFAVINPHIPTRIDDPGALDADYNANGIRDETPASVSDGMRSGLIHILEDLRTRTSDTQMVMGNTGPEPQLALAPYVNGFVLECTNSAWEPPGGNGFDEGAWRRVFDGYRLMQAASRRPAINIVNGCSGAYNNYSGAAVTPTAADIRRQRMVLGTALLDDGFYDYVLCCPSGAPAWFDEMTVDANGVAVEDRRYKGYLGHPLGPAAEQAPGGPVIFQSDFEGATLPASLTASGTVLLSGAAGEVISGRQSLVLSNPDHTRRGRVSVATRLGQLQLTPGHSYLIRLDWRVLETLDEEFIVRLCRGNVCVKQDARFRLVAGDNGVLNLPLTVASAADNWILSVELVNGGRLAIDNLRVEQGGAKPWRRDFENGFVLVNPFTVAWNLSAADLRGALGRTRIRRIKGTQAPDVNNGEPVDDGLTLAPFDAIILLADRVAVETPVITTIQTAGGFQGVAQNDWIEIRGLHLTPPGVSVGGVTWDTAPDFTLGRMPTVLGGVSVTVNGKSAFVYYSSPTQINILSPLDDTTGPVQVVVTSSGVASAPFVVNLQPVAPSFPLVGTTRYLVATHADYSLIGPTSLSVPGYSFTPVKPGETIILYGFG